MSFPEFREFFRSCHRVDPFPWQERLAARVMIEKGWPDVLDLPTGTGKTSTIDIALYVLAWSAYQGEIGAFPRRIFLVVDRRVLVDQAWRRGKGLLDRIGEEPGLVRVREALSRLSGEPPSCVRLRGACPTDPRWCRTADQVQIVATTVDQIGSRLLLRGYGVSPSMRPVEAGIVGQDALLLVDEAHLAGPLLGTLGHLERLNPVREIAPRRQIVPMTATPASGGGTQPFGLEDEDRTDPELARRLEARKRLRWSEKKIDQLLGEIREPCVLLVANTVRTALQWIDRVGAQGSGSDTSRTLFLVTGRMRPLERQRVIDTIDERLTAREPTLVVATQCVEAGVDWDFDAMISECASWDALVQRMGRVNRRGMRDSADCVIIPAQRTAKPPKSVLGGLASENHQRLCPVYGEREAATARWIASLSETTCSPGNMPTAPEGCVRPAATAPMLIREYLDLWSQNRADGPAYDVSVFLQGARDDFDIQVVWRDLDLDRDSESLETLLKALPPSSLEAAPVAVWNFREWIGERRAIVIEPGLAIRPGTEIGPGVTVVVPSAYGGIGSRGTFDRSFGFVPDLSPEALREHRGIEFQIHEAPPPDEEAPIEQQVETWLAEDLSRAPLREWSWVDLGRRWLFVSQLPLDEEDDGGTFRRRRVHLENHLNGVYERTLDTATRLGLSQNLAEDLALAARLHDLGKLDDRFQRLCGRDDASKPLGKSSLTWIARQRMQRVSDYPRGERHEALSVELMLRYGLFEKAHDHELVEHLVASHHGWARPFIRASQGTARIADRVFGVEFLGAPQHSEAERAPRRFRSVQNRYGWLGLAWLEAILRLSDHRQSEGEERGQIASAGGDPLISRPYTLRSDLQPLREVRLSTLNGQLPADFLGVLGILHAFTLASQPALVRWQGTQAILSAAFSTKDPIEEVIQVLSTVRADGIFRGDWPGELNKLGGEQCEALLSSAAPPFRALVVAFLSPGGRSDMDFVSGGRGGFKSTFEWATLTESTAFRREHLLSLLVGPRQLVNGKSFRWASLAAQGARRPTTASADNRSEPWLEWLSVLGAAALVSVPELRRGGRIGTRTTAVQGFDLYGKRLRWPLWSIPLEWQDVPAALAATPSSLRDALWCEAPRLVFGTDKNRVYALGAGRPLLPF